MSGLTPPENDALTLPAVAEQSAEERLRLAVNDALIVLAWSVVTALLAALLWWQQTPLAEFTRVDDAGKGAMGEQELARQVGADGWFFVLAAVFGFLSGVVLLWWRRRDPLLTVVLVALGAVLSTWLMLEIGLALGPPDPGTVLPTVDIGDEVPVQLQVQAHGLYATWGVAALIGAMGVIWGSERR